MASLPSQERTPLLRRARAARLAVKHYDADPYLALYWTIWPSEEIEEAVKGHLGRARRLLSDEQIREEQNQRQRRRYNQRSVA